MGGLRIFLLCVGGFLWVGCRLWTLGRWVGGQVGGRVGQWGLGAQHLRCSLLQQHYSWLALAVPPAAQPGCAVHCIANLARCTACTAHVLPCRLRAPPADELQRQAAAHPPPAALLHRWEGGCSANAAAASSRHSCWVPCCCSVAPGASLWPLPSIVQHHWQAPSASGNLWELMWVRPCLTTLTTMHLYCLYCSLHRPYRRRPQLPGDRPAASSPLLSVLPPPLVLPARVLPVPPQAPTTWRSTWTCTTMPSSPARPSTASSTAWPPSSSKTPSWCRVSGLRARERVGGRWGAGAGGLGGCLCAELWGLGGVWGSWCGRKHSSWMLAGPAV